jgi:hypothetical protein
MYDLLPLILKKTTGLPTYFLSLVSKWLLRLEGFIPTLNNTSQHKTQ